jgi:hypothetical protein
MQAKQQSASFAVPLLGSVLLIFLSVGVAQEVPQSGSPQSGQSQPSGVTIDPSAGPLKPSGQPSNTPLPNAPQPAATPAPPQQRSSRPPALPTVPEPLGAAAAEQVRTAGGGASRPAGNAIAPAKQHQYRSLLIKLGAVAAAGVAVGTVYGLSHATASTPPHSTVAAAK